MRYLSAALIVLGFGIIAGAETQEWIPMLITQSILGLLTLGSGVAMASQISTSEDD
jgi:hypothetical protein